MEILVQKYICSGLGGTSPIHATVPAIPVFISVIGLVPAVIHVLQNKLKMKEKNQNAS